MSFICLVFLPPPDYFSDEEEVIYTGEGTTSSVGSATGPHYAGQSKSAVRQTTPCASASASASTPAPLEQAVLPHLTLSLPHAFGSKQTASYILWLDRMSDQHKPIDNSAQASNFLACLEGRS